MQNFEFWNPVKIVFGRGTIPTVGQHVKEHGRKALLVYGQGSIKRNGVYDRVVGSLNEAGVKVVEFPGVQPNPVLSHVRKGVKLGQDEKVDVVLAVGGGSVIDESKALAGSIATGSDVWDVFQGTAAYDAALPLVDVLTVPAAGSEMNNGLVITNEEARIKDGGCFGPHLYPKVSICDPTVMDTVPRQYLLYAAADVLSHLLEAYLNHEDPNTAVQDRYVEGLCCNVRESLEAILARPDDYDAKATFMWAATLAWNQLALAGIGPFQMPCHMLEHTVSSLYPRVAHGAGLSVLQPAWMAWKTQRDPRRVARFAREVMGVREADDAQAARRGVRLLCDWLAGFGAPLRLGELGIDPAGLDALVAHAAKQAVWWELNAVYTPEAIREIFASCA